MSEDDSLPGESILEEAERSTDAVSDLSDEKLLSLIYSYENADEEFPEGWGGLSSRAAITFELRRRGYDFERDDGELTIHDADGEPVE